jgi:hypothetical protein
LPPQGDPAQIRPAVTAAAHPHRHSDGECGACGHTCSNETKGEYELKNRLTISATTAWLLTISAANAVTQPALKEGLWSIHTKVIATSPNENPSNKKSQNNTEKHQKLCRTHPFDEYSRAQLGEGCTTISETFEGGKYSRVMHCVLPGVVADTTETTSYDSNTSIHGEARSSLRSPLGNAETTLIQNQTYLGKCPAGLLPGDMVEEDGSVVHLWKR